MTHHEERAEVHMRRLDMTHHEIGAEVHPPKDGEAVYDSP
jgi:hypothetical protein